MQGWDGALDGERVGHALRERDVEEGRVRWLSEPVGTWEAAVQELRRCENIGRLGYDAAGNPLPPRRKA